MVLAKSEKILKLLLHDSISLLSFLYLEEYQFIKKRENNNLLSLYIVLKLKAVVINRRGGSSTFIDRVNFQVRYYN